MVFCESISDEDSITANLPSSKKTKIAVEPDYNDDNPQKHDSLVLPAIKKEKREELDLPTPFPLPINYRTDVEQCLKSGIMTTEAKRAFLSSVASKMFMYKKYPTAEEYTRVAIQIITEYPFLKPPSGSPIVYVNKLVIC